VAARLTTLFSGVNPRERSHHAAEEHRSVDRDPRPVAGAVRAGGLRPRSAPEGGHQGRCDERIQLPDDRRQRRALRAGGRPAEHERDHLRPHRARADDPLCHLRRARPGRRRGQPLQGAGGGGATFPQLQTGRILDRYDEIAEDRLIHGGTEAGGIFGSLPLTPTLSSDLVGIFHTQKQNNPCINAGIIE